MKHLTIRQIPAELSRALEREVRRRGQSLNQTVKELLERALGLAPDARYDNGLGRLAGTWSAEDAAEFERATEVFERIDEEDWK